MYCSYVVLKLLLKSTGLCAMIIEYYGVTCWSTERPHHMGPRLRSIASESTYWRLASSRYRVVMSTCRSNVAAAAACSPTYGWYRHVDEHLHNIIIVVIMQTICRAWPRSSGSSSSNNERERGISGNLLSVVITANRGWDGRRTYGGATARRTPRRRTSVLKTDTASDESYDDERNAEIARVSTRGAAATR